MSVTHVGDGRGNRRPVTVLFWLGAGMAPVAALILLAVPGNTALRLGAVLALMSVVLIGLSIALRPTETGGAIAQAALRMVDERVRTLEAEVRSLRATLDRGHDQPATARAYGPHPGQPQLAARPVLESARGSAVVVSPPDQRDVTSQSVSRSGQYGTSAGSVNGTSAGSVNGTPAGFVNGRSGGSVNGTSGGEPARPQPRSGRASVPPAAGQPPVPTGVVRHTETVHVTTRQTIVESDADRSGDSHRPGYGDSDGSGWPAPRQRGHRYGDAPWSPDGPQSAPVSHSEQAREHGWPGELVSGRWSTGDGPAVRDDGDGREVRVGRRRAAVRADHTGAELRVEDQWAAVRHTYPQDEPSVGGGRSGPESPDPRPGRDAGRRSVDQPGRWTDERSDQWTHGPADRWSDSGDLSDRWVDAHHGHGRAGTGRSSDVGDAEWSDRDRTARWEDRSRGDQPAVRDHHGDFGPADGPRSGSSRRAPAALPAGGPSGSQRNGWPEHERALRTGPEQDYPPPRDEPAYDYRRPDGARTAARQVSFGRSDARWR